MAALLGACATAPPPVAGAVTACPHVPPPPPGETTPPLPRSGFAQVLQPGAWSWTGHDYTRVAPRWVTLLAHTKPLWQAAYWSLNGGACVWNEAHFVRPPAGHAAPHTAGAPGAW
jgi:hypothetical protein